MRLWAWAGVGIAWISGSASGADYGGPLLDEKGRVLGLTISGRAPNGAPIGLNFFIPIDDALKALALKSAG